MKTWEENNIMKTICKNLVIIFFISVNVKVNAQNLQIKTGFNFMALVGRTYELTSEISKRNSYSITANLGYTNGTGLAFYKLDDGFYERKTFGKFFKIGGRIYLINLFNIDLTSRLTLCKFINERNDLFLGLLVIGSEYNESAKKRNYIIPLHIPPETDEYKSSGFIWGIAVVAGYTINLYKRLDLDMGAQLSFPQRRDDYVGSSFRTYQPGMGSLFLPTEVGERFQFIFVLKYRLFKNIL